MNATHIDPDHPSVRQRLAEEDIGAQSMEYAALAAGGCGIVALLIALWESEPVQNAVGGLLTGALETLGNSLSGILPF